jgi:metallo-beta-lactamase class B
MRRIATTIISLFSLANIFGQAVDSGLKISHLTGDFYVYETFKPYNGKIIPANGMYIVTDNGIIMLDTPWDTTQFQPLLDSIKTKHHKAVVLCISTHFHDDRTGGLEYYRQKGMKTYTTLQTDAFSKKNNKKRAQFLFNGDSVFTVGQYSFRAYFPGPGHTRDNIVVWFDKEKILYGGCLIKSTVDTDLGNLGDADVKKYASTIRNVQQKFKNPKFVIPGHNDWTSTKSIEHTLEMAEKYEKDHR